MRYSNIIIKPHTNIFIIAPVHEPIRKDMKYGGTERVVRDLLEGYRQLGLENVHLLAAGDVDAEIKKQYHFHSLVPRSLRNSPPYDSDVVAREMMGFFAAAKALDIIDRIGGPGVIHNHLGSPAALLHARGCAVPMVTTLHGFLGSLPEKSAYMHSSLHGHPVVSISNDQRAPLPYLNYIDTVYDPVSTKGLVPRYNVEDAQGVWPGYKPGEYLACLGRSSSEKGWDVAIKIAARLNMPLVIAGKVDVSDRKFFEDTIQPLLSQYSHLVEFVGEVDDEKKNLLLRGARAFLMPIRWAEPFGLVVPEAMACGTPVVATKIGAMPELIDHGVDGYLVPAEEDEQVFIQAFADAVLDCEKIDRMICREHVEERFSPAVVAQKYLHVYEDVLSKSSYSRRLISMPQ